MKSVVILEHPWDLLRRSIHSPWFRLFCELSLGTIFPSGLFALQSLPPVLWYQILV